MTLAPGTKLGPYEIAAPLGSGGMGEVYRARDTRLGRDVAIKVLPDALAADAERLARFEREARLLASMNHSSIASIYGIEDAGGRPALVMEVVEGSTLAERLERGPLPEEEALGIARQLAEALEYAHDVGIVHRDLKPANVKLRPDGVVKVLDFGLARALEAAPAGSTGDLTQSPTLTQRMTTAGVILGTAAYMSPEQARGREVDRRADIWAFGAVLYEILTGARAFKGETISDTLASVMRDDPDWSLLPAGLAPGWRRLIGRCLTKDARTRLQAIGEARIALADLSAGADGGDMGASTTSARPPGAPTLALAALGIVVLVLATWAVLRRSPTPPAATEVSMMLSPGQRLGEDRGYNFFAISPNGRAIAFTVRQGGTMKLRLRRLDRREEIDLPGTDGARNMFFSPDGEWIAFFNGLKLSKVSVQGGLPVVLADAGQDRLGTWLRDGTIVYSAETTTPLLRIPASGGPPVAVTALDTTQQERTHRFPCALDGGPWVVFTVGRTDSPGGYDDSPIDAVNVNTRERRRLVKGARCAVWAPPGYLVFDRAGDLYALRIDPRDPRPGQESQPVMAGVGGETSSGAGFFGFSNDGTLAWIPAEEHSDERQVGWFDRAGKWTPTSLPSGPYLKLALSPDASRALVLSGAGGGSADLWVADLASGGMNRLTYGNIANPGLWLPDGQRFVYSRLEPSGTQSIVVRRLDGAGGERVIFRADWPLFVSSLTPDGRGVLINDYGRPQGRIHVANVDGEPKARELPADPGNLFNEQAGMVSPDGKWLAYVSNRTRREEVYVRSFDGTGGRWQVSAGGGGAPHWGRDGRELLLVSQGGETLMRVALETRGVSLGVSQPEPLFELPPSPIEPTYRDYDYDRLRDRFLFTRPPVGVNERREIALSLGWTSRLSARMRAGATVK